MRTTRISTVIVSFAAAAALALTGCAVETSETPADPGTSPVVSEEPESTPDSAKERETNEPEDVEPTEPQAPDTDPEDITDDDFAWPQVDQGTVESRFTRDDIAALATAQVNCSGGSVEIDKIGFVTQVTEDCENLTISGDAGSIVAENVGTLTVSGIGNTVFVKSVTAVAIEDKGSVNLVVYEGAAPSLTEPRGECGSRGASWF